MDVVNAGQILSCVVNFEWAGLAGSLTCSSFVKLRGFMPASAFSSFPTAIFILDGVHTLSLLIF